MGRPQRITEKCNSIEKECEKRGYSEEETDALLAIFNLLYMGFDLTFNDPQNKEAVVRIFCETPYSEVFVMDMDFNAHSIFAPIITKTFETFELITILMHYKDCTMELSQKVRIRHF